MHPSIVSHLDIEYHLLQALYTRSKHQHRTQPFVRRLEQVLRIVRLLRDDWNDLLLQKVGTGNAPLTVACLRARISHAGIEQYHTIESFLALADGIDGDLWTIVRPCQGRSRTKCD